MSTANRRPLNGRAERAGPDEGCVPVPIRLALEGQAWSREQPAPDLNGWAWSFAQLLQGADVSIRDLAAWAGWGTTRAARVLADVQRAFSATAPAKEPGERHLSKVGPATRHDRDSSATAARQVERGAVDVLDEERDRSATEARQKRDTADSSPLLGIHLVDHLDQGQDSKPIQVQLPLARRSPPEEAFVELARSQPVWRVDLEADLAWFAREIEPFAAQGVDLVGAIRDWRDYCEDQHRALKAGANNRFPTNWKAALRRHMVRVSGAEPPPARRRRATNAPSTPRAANPLGAPATPPTGGPAALTYDHAAAAAFDRPGDL